MPHISPTPRVRVKMVGNAHPTRLTHGNITSHLISDSLNKSFSPFLLIVSLPFSFRFPHKTLPFSPIWLQLKGDLCHILFHIFQAPFYKGTQPWCFHPGSNKALPDCSLQRQGQ